MFKLLKSTEPTAIDDEIKAVLDDMSREGPSSENYPELMGLLERLYKLKAQQCPEKVSADTKAMVLGNVGIAILMLSHERMHVITSKAIMFIKPMGKTSAYM